jgi:hypothetical protein
MADHAVTAALGNPAAADLPSGAAAGPTHAGPRHTVGTQTSAGPFPADRNEENL